MRLFGPRSNIKLLLPLALTACALTAHAQWAWQTDYEKASKLAAKQHKPLLVVFHAEWCGPCHMLEDNVFSQAKVKAALQRVVGVRIDVDQNPELSKKFQISSIPRMLMYGTDGRHVVYDALGYRDMDTFLTEFSGALGVSASSISTAAKPEPASLTQAEQALSAGSWTQFKAKDPKAATEGLRLMVEKLGVYDEKSYAPVAANFEKAGRDCVPALIAGMNHKFLAVRAGAFRELQAILGTAKPKLAFDPWARASVRKNQISAWQNWAKSAGYI